MDFSVALDGAEGGLKGTENEPRRERETELYEEDADGWQYRGEGAANIVLAYCGRRPAFIGRVLRIRKVSAKKANGKGVENNDRQAKPPILSQDEQRLWIESPAMAEVTTPAGLAHVYAREVIQPLLGREHVDAGLLVYLSREFVEAVNHDVASKQPAWREKAGRLDLAGGVALLISDHSSFASLRVNVHDLPPTITIEIKPKWGSLPLATTITKENAVKRQVSRFAMHQQLKLKEGKIKSLSSYSPLDLFSGTMEGIHKALLALLETPQNNLRIFANGIEVFPGAEGNAGSPESCKGTLEDSLEGFSFVPKGERLLAFRRLVAHILHQSKILGRLLAVQKLDAYDIEGAILAYKNLLEQDPGAAEAQHDNTTRKENMSVESLALENEEEQYQRDQDWIRSLSWNDSRRIVRNYLIAATAKDCGLMLTLRPFQNGSVSAFPVPSTSVACCPTTKQQYSYKISLLDLDVKRLHKMPFYYRLDQEIVQHYKASLVQE